MSFKLDLPIISGEPLPITVEVGQCLFVLGSNGSGKSSLMHRYYANYQQQSKRISAHRQTWFSSSAITLSPEQKRQTENNIKSRDVNVESRWKDDFSQQRASIAIFDLIDAENVRARKIAGAVDTSNIELAQTLSKEDAPIKVINELLRLSNIPIEIDVQENERVVASKLGSPIYSVAELSDGERNALLIAANVLTAKENTLLLIDEPERHLHRSIISPLLKNLIEKRPDCGFIISTHDIMLALDNPNSMALLVRGCKYSGTNVTAWDANLVSPESIDDEELKQDILGSRKKILFIEGSKTSLDKPIYSLLFPDTSIIIKGSCRDVERAVVGIRDADNLHWLDAFGIIDNDGRTDSDIERLKTKGVYALSTFSVESIYYHPEIQQRIAERQSGLLGVDAKTLFESAKSAAFSAIQKNTDRLSKRIAEKKIRGLFFSYLPSHKNISETADINLTIPIQSIVSKEKSKLEELVKSACLETLVNCYPIRETSALADIAKQLNFINRTQYEAAVLKLLMDDNETLNFAQSLFGTLKEDLEQA